MSEWMIDEAVDERTVRRSVLAASAFAERGDAAPASPRALALRLRDVIVHDNKKWFDLVKGADVRLDAIVVQGNILADDPRNAYAPVTFRFPEVGDGDALVDEPLLVYYGWPEHFLDLSVMVSRDTRDSDDLAMLLSDAAGNPDFQTAVAGLFGLAVAAPPAAAVVAALSSARALGDLAYRAVRAASGTTIGFYRGSRLAYPERFGLGRNPAQGNYRKQHLSFWYEVLEAEQPHPA
jgi:hypothetical protein